MRPSAPRTPWLTPLALVVFALSCSDPGEANDASLGADASVTTDGAVATDGGDVGDGSVTNDAGGPPAWHFGPVTVGGGGYVTGLVVNPTSGAVYARTDIGGAYRWDDAGSTWRPLLDWTPTSSWFGVAGLATQASDGSSIAFLVGRGSAPSVLVSHDRGATLTEAIAASQASADWPGAAVDGNSRDGRWGGERLVYAADGSLWVATRGQGLWHGTPSGTTFAWSREAVLTTPATATFRALAEASDGTLYAAVEDDDVFARSSTGTWTSTGLSLAGAADVIRLAADGTTLYATLGTPSSTAGASTGSVKKRSGGAWSDITPAGAPPPNGWGGLAASAGHVAVAANMMTHAPVMYSGNGGSTWSLASPADDKARATQLLDAPGWWPIFFFDDHTAGMAFDPASPTRLWLTDFYGIWRTDDASAAAPVWHAKEHGHEELVVLFLDPLPGGGIMSGTSDVFGFYQPDPSTPPTASDTTLKGYTESTAGGHAPSDANVRYRAITKDETNDGMSRFDGTTWSQETSFPARESFDLAVSTTNADLVVAAAFGGRPLRRDPTSKTWSEIASLPVDGHAAGEQNQYQRDRPLVADGSDGQTFYFYDSGKLWVTRDGAATFTVAATLPVASPVQVQATLGVAGEAWIALQNAGLYHVTGFGKTVTKVAGVTSAIAVAVGAPLAGSSTPELYLVGDPSGGRGVYQSPSDTIAWTVVTKTEIPIAMIRGFEASADVPGLLFFGTGGRGMLYARFE